MSHIDKFFILFYRKELLNKERNRLLPKAGVISVSIHYTNHFASAIRNLLCKKIYTLLFLFLPVLLNCGKNPLGEPPLSGDGFSIYKNDYSSGSDGGMKSALEETIDSATQSLDCAISGLSQSSVISKILVKARQSGIRIRIAFDEDVYSTDTGAQAFASSGLFSINSAGKNSIHYGNKGTGVMRHNFCSADERIVFISTSAFEDHQMRNLPNVAVKIGSSKFGLPREFLKEMNMLSERLFGTGKGKLDFATKFTALDQVIGLYWGPQEDPLDVLAAELAEARNSIYFYSTSFQSTSTKTDKDLPQVLRRLEVNKSVPIYPVVTTQALFESSGKIGELNAARQVAFAQTRIGANFFVMERGTPQARTFIYTGAIRSKANSSDDGLLIILKGERVAEYLASFAKSMYDSGSTISATGTDIPTDNQREVIFSEIMWMGSYDDSGGTFADDEFIELYNTTASAINISRWKIGCTADSSTLTSGNSYITLPDNATIAPYGYFVIGRKSDLAFRYPDWITDKNILTENMVQCILTDGDSSSIAAFSAAAPTFTGTIVDKAGDAGTSFSSGPNYGLDDSSGKVRRSMERITPIADGALSSSWKTNSLTSVRNEYVAGGYNQRTFATPGASNIYFQVEQAYPISATQLRIHFSETPVTAGAENSANYCIASKTATSCSSSILSASSVSLAGKIATVTFSTAIDQGVFKVFVNNITSLANSAVLSPAYAEFSDFRTLYVNSNATFENFTGANPDNFTVNGLTSSQVTGISGNALNLAGGPLGSNDDILTLTTPANITKGTCANLAFMVKGTAQKNLVVVMDSSRNFNLNDLNLTGKPVSPSSSASYTSGTINTGGEWKRVSLDILTVSNTSTFKLKAGSTATYNLDIDQIHFENCEPDTAPPSILAFTPSNSGLFSTSATDIAVSFNKPMTVASITTTSLRVVPGNDCATGSLTASGVVASEGDTKFTLTLNGGQLVATNSYSTCVDATVQSSNAVNMTNQAIATWTAANPGSFYSDLLISEYTEGNSNNKYVEIYNGTGSSINLDNYRLGLHSNMSTTAGKTMTFTSGTVLETGKTWVTCNTSMATNLQWGCNQFDGNVISFNGDDAVVLQKNISGNWTTIDIIGDVTGTDTGDGWNIPAGTVCSGCTAGSSSVDSILMRGNLVVDPTSVPATSFPQWTATIANSDANLLLNTGMGARSGTAFALVSATVISPTSVQITFNDAPKLAQAQTAGNYSINSGEISVSAAVLAGNTVTLTTGTQTSGVTYTVVVSSVERNSNSQAMTANSINFTGYLPARVRSVVPVYGNIIDINFDQNLSSATIDAFPARFTVSGGLTVNTATLQTIGAHANKRVRLVLSGNQTAGTSYSVTVNTSVQDATGNNISSSGNTGTFLGYSPDYGIMEANTAGMEGSFNTYYSTSGGSPANSTAQAYSGVNSFLWSTLTSDTSCSGGRTARTIGYYPVTPGASMTGSVFMRAITVTGGGFVRGRLRAYWYQDASGTVSATLNTLDSGATSFSSAGMWTSHSNIFTVPADAYYMQLQIHGCYSSPATNSDQLYFDQAFWGTPAFRVISASSTGNGSVQITFSDAPQSGNGATGSENTANYTITGNGGLTITGASLSGSTVTLTTSSQASGTYTVTASNITRTADGYNLMGASANFSGTALGNFNVNSASATGSDKVAVTFSEAPTAATATTPGNYSIPGLTVSGASLAGNIVTLTTTGQTPNTAYTVTASNILRQLDNATLTTVSANFNGFWGLVNGSFEADTNSCSSSSTTAPVTYTGTCPNGWVVHYTDTQPRNFNAVAGSAQEGSRIAQFSHYTGTFGNREIRSTVCLSINNTQTLTLTGWFSRSNATGSPSGRMLVARYASTDCTGTDDGDSNEGTSGVSISADNTWTQFSRTLTTGNLSGYNSIKVRVQLRGSATPNLIFDNFSISQP